MSEETAVPEAEAIVGEIVAKVAEFATEARIEITAEEKLSVSKLENDFLRAQSEITRLQGVIKDAQGKFPQVIQALVVKYRINALTHIFDNVELVFKSK